MPEEKKPKYPLDKATLDQATACRKGFVCLDNGPACAVGAVVNSETLIVTCQNDESACPFYRAPDTFQGGTSHGPCACPVRHALRKKYDL